MKGILLAGGSGSRLYPMTRTTSKQLLPVYDKPLIYYPLSTLMDLGITEIVVISTPRDLPGIRSLLGGGAEFGLRLSYRVQNRPEGIAQSLLIASDFIDEDICLILGDNLFMLNGELARLRSLASGPALETAAVVLCPVKDPERFGVADCDAGGRVLRLVEKPKLPTSNLAVTGLYFYPSDVAGLAATLRPSARGELEITDLNNLYLAQGRLRALRLERESRWLDAGTPDALLEASELAARAWRNERNPAGYPEEMARRRGLISQEDYEALLRSMKPGTPYLEHLRALSASLWRS